MRTSLTTPRPATPRHTARLAALLAIAVAITGLTGLSSPQRAEACGGFFCSSPSLPVNQSAERIVFSKNDDGTVTAIVQILYNGPADRFAWFLPVPGVPTLDVSSDTFFALLQGATNPNYIFMTDIYGDCNQNILGSANNSAMNNGIVVNNGDTHGGVSVLASGALGPFDDDVIEVTASVEDKAALAVEWLDANNYFIAPGQEELIGPYLDAGMNLIAFRLQKDREAGDIQPIVMTYQTDQPMIPIKLTAVAADDNMGALVWVLGDHRAVPINYRSLVLNAAAIDWFNPGRSYDDVINAAADDAGGQGFVTEMAEQTEGLGTTFDTSTQQDLLDRARASDSISNINDILNTMGTWNGMNTALESTLLNGLDVSADEFLACPRCTLYSDVFGETGPDVVAFADAVQEWVLDPVKRSVDIFMSRPWMTRLYTTMNASDMTVDPLFDFNPDLPTVSNLHQAELNIDTCGDEWYMDLPGRQRVWGDVVGNWPFSAGNAMPANARIEQLSTAGDGQIVTDNHETIQRALQTQMDRVSPQALEESDGCACTTTSRRSAPASRALLLSAALLVLVATARQRR